MLSAWQMRTPATGRMSRWLDCNPDVCLLPQVSSAFSQLLNLHNLSEEISSAQLERAVRMGEARTPGPR